MRTELRNTVGRKEVYAMDTFLVVQDYNCTTLLIYMGIQVTIKVKAKLPLSTTP